MAPDPKYRRGRSPLRLAQLLLVLAAAGLWGASRLPWVTIRSFDGLGQPKQVTVSGASWSTALLPLALLALAAAIAAVAVRGWPLQVLGALTATVSFAAGYLAISMWAARDVAARGAAIAGVPVVSLLGADRHYTGAAITLMAAACIVSGGTLLMRSAVRRHAATGDDKTSKTPEVSERMIWDALDRGGDPTDEPNDRAPGLEPEGR